MTDETNDTGEHAETEAQLRAALTARADSVEPGPADASAAIAAGAAARKRRTFLAVAAVILLLAAVAGAVFLLGDDGEEDVATGPDPTTTTTVLAVGSDLPVIWPLPTMSVQYETPIDAATAFYTEYLGLPGECGESAEPFGGTQEVPCVPAVASCPANASCSSGGYAPTEVLVEPRGLGFVVLSAATGAFDVTAPEAGAVVGANITVDVIGLEGSGVAELRPLGEPAGSAPTVDTNSVPLGADGSWHVVLGAADGQVVAIVSDGASATARVITVDSVGVPTETTTTVAPPPPLTDDGVQGWPGNTSRHFDSPDVAADTFVTEVLGFAEPTVTGRASNASGPPDTTISFAFRSRPQASLETVVDVHDTGTARGWVVTRVQGEGTIDSVTRNGEDVTVTGIASAFEATLDIRLYDLQGTVLGETFTHAGANGELGPYEATIHQDVAATGPIFVQIAEGDATGEGSYIWATWAEVPA